MNVSSFRLFFKRNLYPSAVKLPFLKLEVLILLWRDGGYSPSQLLSQFCFLLLSIFKVMWPHMKYLIERSQPLLVFCGSMALWGVLSRFLRSQKLWVERTCMACGIWPSQVCPCLNISGEVCVFVFVHAFCLLTFMQTRAEPGDLDWRHSFEILEFSITCWCGRLYWWWCVQ